MVLSVNSISTAGKFLSDVGFIGLFIDMFEAVDDLLLGKFERMWIKSRLDLDRISMVCFCGATG